MTRPTWPTRPTDISATAGFEAVLERYRWFSVNLIEHGDGRGHPNRPPASLAIATLVLQQVLATRVLASRWAYVRDALVYGATLAQVATATAATPEAVVVGLRAWADEQLALHDAQEGIGLSRDEYREVLGLLAATSGGGGR